MKEYYDKNVNEIFLKIGDKIKIRDFSKHKLESFYRGPYVVEKIENENVTAVEPGTQESDRAQEQGEENVIFYPN